MYIDFSGWSVSTMFGFRRFCLYLRFDIHIQVYRYESDSSHLGYFIEKVLQNTQIQNLKHSNYGKGMHIEYLQIFYWGILSNFCINTHLKHLLPFLLRKPFWTTSVIIIQLAKNIVSFLSLIRKIVELLPKIPDCSILLFCRR